MPKISILELTLKIWKHKIFVDDKFNIQEEF